MPGLLVCSGPRFSHAGMNLHILWLHLVYSRDELVPFLYAVVGEECTVVFCKFRQSCQQAAITQQMLVASAWRPRHLPHALNCLMGAFWKLVRPCWGALVLVLG